MTFILILMMHSHLGDAIAMQEFSSQKACELAGKQVVTNRDPFMYEYMCVEK